MDKEFWFSIAKNDYKIPGGYKLKDLTKTLFGYLASSDPELRDDIAYIVYANFLKREMYSQDEIRTQVEDLLSNLDKGIGETDSDSVFLRSFSVLCLAEIIYRDNKKPMLDEELVRLLLDKGIWYLDAENDPRGYIPVKGWAHALAHTADLMLELGRNRFVEKDDLEKILQGIARKLKHSTNWVYIHGEDERLANAVMSIIQRNMASIDFLKNWFKSMTEPEKSWKGAYIDEGQVKAYHNVRNFLLNMDITVRAAEGFPNKEQIEFAVFESVKNLKPY